MTLPSSGNLPQYPAFANARTYDAEFDRMLAQAYLLNGEGIASTSAPTGTTLPGDLLVTTAGSGLNVSAAAGRAFVQGDGRSTQGAYFCYVPTANTVTLSTADATNPRIDQIILAVDDADVSGSATQWRPDKVTGTPTVGATLANLSGAGALPATAIRLAYVLVPAGFTGPFVNNTHILDQRNIALKQAQCCKLYRSAALNHTATGSYQTITWDAAAIDNMRGQSNSGGAVAIDSKINIREDGLYQIAAGVSFAGNTTGTRYMRIKKNGAQLFQDQRIHALSNAVQHTMTASCIAKLSVGDYIECDAQQSSGGNLAYGVGEDLTWLAINRIA